MRVENVNKLCCPACHKRYTLRAEKKLDEQIETALLTCSRCCITIPIVRGFPIFDQQFLIENPDLDELSLKLFGPAEEYFSFLDHKHEKPVFDLYAAFQPFNEATQSLFPLLPLLKQAVKPGDLILDLWCRTGWSGEFLSSYFPEQQVISIWESSAGILGLKGFDFWLGSGKRRKNLDIVFHSLNQPLPFSDETFAIVHGIDTLHRYPHVPLISECLRVATRDGILVFPHNHLTNSEPDPYFDRGENQFHGLEYKNYFERLFKKAEYQAFVLSEKTLFDARSKYQLKDESDTTHYNACILIAPEKYAGKTFSRTKKIANHYRQGYIVTNPLYKIDWIKGEAVPAPEAMDFGGETLFFRHPIYQERLTKHSPIQLDELDRLILYWAMRIKSIEEIATNLNLDGDEIFAHVLELESKELIQVQNISKAMAKLQSHYFRQEVPYTDAEASLSALWKRSILLHKDKSFVVWPNDGSTFTYGDADLIVRKAASFLISNGIKKGDCILIDALSHPEFLFLFWAGILLGAVMVPLDRNLNQKEYSTVLERSKPALVLHAPKRFRDLKVKSFCYGAIEDSDEFKGSFSEMIKEFAPYQDFPECQENQDAVILFAPASSTKVKGVVLTHGALFRTSLIMDRSYGWRSSDRYLSERHFHTMNGLRNSVITVLHSGASVIIPGNENMHDPVKLMNVCIEYQATILNVSTTFVAFWRIAEHKIQDFQAHKMRMVQTTGSALHFAHRENFEKHFRVPIYEYYSLMETTGACILQTPHHTGDEEVGIGKPKGCLVKIVNSKGDVLPQGSTGELAIYSENLMKAYLGEDGKTRKRIKNGWFMTGDRARINETGFVILSGRMDRMMIDKNGENVHPEEIERLICSAEGVNDAFVTQVQDHKQKELIAALVQFITLNENEEALVSRLKSVLESKLPLMQIPSIILAVQQIPKSSTGKVSTADCKKLIEQFLTK